MRDSDGLESRLRELTLRKLSTQSMEQIHRDTSDAMQQPAGPSYHYWRWAGIALAASIMLSLIIYEALAGSRPQDEPESPSITRKAVPDKSTIRTVDSTNNPPVRSHSVERVYGEWPGRLVIKDMTPKQEIHRVWMRTNELEFPRSNTRIRWHEPQHEVVLVDYQTY